MKSFFLQSLFILFTIFLGSTTLQAQCDCTPENTITAGNGNVDITSGQTKCFKAGTFTGNFNLYAGGKLFICAGANFKPGNINNFAGEIVNYGTLQPNQSFSFSQGAKIDNFGRFVLNKSLNFNGSATIINEWEGRFFLNVDFNLNNGSTLSNYGIVMSKGSGNNLSTNNNSTINNYGILRIQDGNFNPQGTFLNEGMAYAGKQVNINSGTNVINNCRIVFAKGMNHNGNNFENNGFIWSAGEDGNSSHIQLNGGSKIINGPFAQIRGVRFTNGGTVNGYGEFYMTEQTKQQGTFTGSNSGSPIRFFDVSQTGSKIMDIESPAPTVTIRPATMTPLDTLDFGNVCTNQNYRDLITIGQLPLPIKLIYFNGACDGVDIKLNWLTSEEVNITGYNVEGSVDGKNFEVDGKLYARGTDFNYSYTTDNTNYKYFRLAVQEKGYESYSNVVTVKCDSKASISNSSISPNPNNGRFKVHFYAETSGPVEIKILNAQSQIFFTDKFESAKGQNSFEVALNKVQSGFYVAIIKDQQGKATYLRFLIN